MEENTHYFLYRLHNAHPGVVGETMLIVTVAPKSGGGLIGRYHLLTAAHGGKISTGQVTVDQSVLNLVKPEDSVAFCRDETAQFADSEIAQRLLDAEGKFGTASVFSQTRELQPADLTALRSMYVRGQLLGKWTALVSICAAKDLAAIIDAWQRVSPLEVQAM